MTTKTFSVVINPTTRPEGAVRIDDLLVDYAIEHSAYFRDSLSPEAIHQNQPIVITSSCYDENHEPAEFVSETLLRWLFGLFQPIETRPGLDPDDHSLRSCCHALQIMCCLGTPYWGDIMVPKILRECSLPEFASAVRPFYAAMPRAVQQPLTYQVAQALKHERFHCNHYKVEHAVTAACMMLADLIMSGADYDLSMASAYRSILANNPAGEFFCWSGGDVSLTRNRIARCDVDRFLLLPGGVRVGFLFTDPYSKPKPIGWFILEPFDGHIESDLCVRLILKDQHGHWTENPRSIHRDASLDFPLVGVRVLSTGCIKTDNPYECSRFVQQVCNTLGITMHDIEAKANNKK